MLENIYVLLKSNSFIDQTVLNDWLRTENILNDSFYCVKCKLNMGVNKSNKDAYGGMFKYKKCFFTKSIKWRTYFYNMRFSLYEILQLIVLFVEDEYVKDIYSTGFYLKPKVVSFLRALRKTCTRYCDECFDRIGENAVVEIDETVISKRKYNMDRIINFQWLLDV